MENHLKIIIESFYVNEGFLQKINCKRLKVQISETSKGIDALNLQLEKCRKIEDSNKRLSCIFTTTQRAREMQDRLRQYNEKYKQKCKGIK
jgi:predicted phage tail protein